MTAIDAVVLAGGRGTRLGGVDKPGVRIGDCTLLDRAVAAVSAARSTVVVGPPRTGLPAAVRQVREDPAFAGPAAALGAGLSSLGTTGVPAPLTVVLAADLPAAVPAVGALLGSVDADALPGIDGWVGTDEGGRRQYLLAVYRTDALRRACDELAAERGTLADASVRQLLGRLRLHDVPLPRGTSIDVDTPGDLASAVHREEFHR